MKNIDFSKDYKAYKNNETTLNELAKKYDRTTACIRSWIIKYEQYGYVIKPEKTKVNTYGLKLHNIRNIINTARFPKDYEEAKGSMICCTYKGFQLYLNTSIFKVNNMTRLYGTFFEVCPLKRGITAQEIYDAVYAKIDDINAHIEAMAAEKVDKKSYRSFFVTLEEYNKLKQYLEEIRKE